MGKLRRSVAAVCRPRGGAVRALSVRGLGVDTWRRARWSLRTDPPLLLGDAAAERGNKSTEIGRHFGTGSRERVGAATAHAWPKSGADGHAAADDAREGDREYEREPTGLRLRLRRSYEWYSSARPGRQSCGRRSCCRRLEAWWCAKSSGGACRMCIYSMSACRMSASTSNPMPSLNTKCWLDIATQGIRECTPVRVRTSATTTQCE